MPEKTLVSDTCPSFNSARDKLVLKSKDGLLFRVDRQKLMAVSHGFEAILGMDVDTSQQEDQKPVVLEEKNDVLELFLRFALKKPIPPKVTLFRLLPVLAAFQKYDIDTSGTSLCDYLVLNCLGVGTTPRIWSICAKAGQEGLARACLAHFSDHWSSDLHPALVDGKAALVKSRPYAPHNMSAEDLDGVPGTSLAYMLQCYDRVHRLGQPWAVAAIED